MFATLIAPPVLKPVFACLLGLYLAGCMGTQPVRVEDDSAGLASLRAVHRSNHQAGGSGLELLATSFRARDTELVPEDRSASIGGQVVFGPALLQQTVRLGAFGINYNYLASAGSRVEVEWLVGAATVQSTRQVRTDAAPGVTERLRHNFSGATYGVMLRLNLRPHVALEARYTRTAKVPFPGLEDEWFGMGELALGYQLADAWQVRLGLHESHSHLYPEFGPDLQVRARGLLLGALWRF